MVSNIILNNTVISVYHYKENRQDDFLNIVIDFKVTSENYHDIATLLYEGVFDVKVPEKGLTFRGAIQEYYTSMTNLYKKGEVGDYHVSLLEVKNEEKRMS
ncbi:YkvR family protein [Lederbergia sp. NSJ-179]|uniref:DUF3219 family protein n=1 Tax=Lederbergia sp. NSJ-179 TaxID=2931402 RepID=UPI001FD33AD1|nr:DUF3219 family protein [Lederbergia sp. NSJ-179]MCJ7841619.1 YkvR family protein [Lederbergia sp. NSJ-179]